MVVMFNPKIVGYSEETISMEEGCLTFPNLFMKITRPVVVRVRFRMPNGMTETKKYDGLTARIIQHEIDHLDGVLFMTRANKIERERAYKRKKKLDREEKKKTG